jgi:hypothetical protein
MEERIMAGQNPFRNPEVQRIVRVAKAKGALGVSPVWALVFVSKRILCFPLFSNFIDQTRMSAFVLGGGAREALPRHLAGWG